MKKPEISAVKFILASFMAAAVLGNSIADMTVLAGEEPAEYTQEAATSSSSSESGAAEAAGTASGSAADISETDISTEGADTTEISETETDATDVVTEYIDTLGIIEADTVTTDSSSVELKNASFYILREVDASIPDEPASHSTIDYTDGIVLENCTFEPEYYDDYVLGSDFDEAELSEGEYTATNAVYDALTVYPSVEEIQNVFPSFDPYKYYVQWYVIKYVGSAIHIDGVVRTRQASVYDEPPEVPSEEPAEEPDVIIDITTVCYNTEFECDGQEHLIGDGFRIKVTEKDSPETFIESIYDKFGNLVKIESSAAAAGEGTYFSYRDKSYWVNIDAAYARVSADTLSSLSVPISFIYDNAIIPITDITVKILDEFGNYVDSDKVLIKVDAKETVVEADPVRSITIEAGSTVQNDNGSTITNDNYEIISGALLSGHSISNIVFNGSQTGAGTSSNEITSCTIVDENGNDVTSKYRITYKNGKLILVDAGDTTDSASASSSVTTTTGTATASSSKSNYASLSKVTESGSLALDDSQLGTGTAANADGTPQVLGARRSSTADSTVPGYLRIIVMLACVLILGKAFRKKILFER